MQSVFNSALYYYHLNMTAIFLQLLSVILVSLCNACANITILWTSPILPQLLSEQSPIGVQITKNEASLITSMLYFGATAGTLILGPLIDYFGRRGALLISAVPMFLSWLLILFAWSVSLLYAARFVLGVSAVIGISVPIIYVGEIAEAKHRGKLTIICSLIGEAGGILTVVLGSLNNSYLILGIFSAVLNLLFFVFFYFMPETPYYFVKNGDFTKAEQSLKRFRDSDDVSEEIKRIMLTVEEQTNPGNNFMQLFTVKKFRKSFGIIMGLKTLQAMSGTVAIHSYMNTIFIDANTGLDENTSSIISISVGLPSIILASFLIDKAGRKTLYYLATLGTMSALLLESIYFFLQDDTTLRHSFLVWIPVTGIFIYKIFWSFGIVTLPILILGELLPPQVKGHATTLGMAYNAIFACVLSWGFPGFSEKFGYGVSFLIFAVSCFAGFLFVRFVLPETKGKMLAEDVNLELKCRAV